MFKMKRIKNFFIAILLLLTLSNTIYVVSANENNKISTTANGIVVNMETGTPISDAIVTYSEINSNNFVRVKTDENGRFYINSIETGYYNWKVENDKYNAGLFNGYPIVSGGNNYFFEISQNNKVELDYNRQVETFAIMM